jgi:CDP-6-deoxy-D-xylo-4-hexulose-3-dehydrase
MTQAKKFPLMVDNIGRGDANAVIDFLSQDPLPRLTNGEQVRNFENLWSKWLGCRHSVFVSSGAASNFITIQWLKYRFPNGGKVIVPPFTWISDISSLIYHGFEPVFVDISLTTLSLDCEKVMESISRDNQIIAVFFTHAQGFDGFSNEFIEFLSGSDVVLLEDVCESHGASHGNKKLGTFGEVSNFSFFYAHHMSTIEGGMICTNDHETYQLLRSFRSHGMLREMSDPNLRDKVLAHNDPKLNPEFVFISPSLNFRNTEIGAVIGINQLKSLDQKNKIRKDNFTHYLKSIENTGLYDRFKNEGSCNYAFPVILKYESKDHLASIKSAMDRSGIEYRQGSVGGGNQLRQPYLRGTKWASNPDAFENTDYVHTYGFYIGNHPDLSVDQIDEICHVLRTSC